MSSWDIKGHQRAMVKGAAKGSWIGFGKKPTGKRAKVNGRAAVVRLRTPTRENRHVGRQMPRNKNGKNRTIHPMTSTKNIQE
jgi:hypothetical protein